MPRIVKCLRCGYEWATRLDNPVRCAKCRSPYWDIGKGISEVAAELPDDAPIVKTAKKFVETKACKHGSHPFLCRYEECRRKA